MIERCVILAAGEVLRVDPNMLNEPQPWAHRTQLIADAGSDRKAQIETMLRQTRGKVYGPGRGGSARHSWNHPRFANPLSLGIRKYSFK